MIGKVRLLLAIGAASSLSGCIAAAAIPVLAGGAMVTSGAGGEKTRPAPRTPQPESPKLEAEGSVVRAPFRPNPPPGPVAPPVEPRAEISEAPAPDAAASPYDAFIAYALAEARPYLPDEKRSSAVLADPGTIRPETRECEAQPPAVLIDLDDGDTPFDPLAVGRIPTELAPALSRLRAKGLRIVWLSGAKGTQATNLRGLLERTMLDPTGRDMIALPAAGERKQVLRERLGREFCIEAIAGDRRADFDELYDYLRDESAAAALEPLIGRGWFIVPAPFGGGN